MSNSRGSLEFSPGDDLKLEPGQTFDEEFLIRKRLGKGGFGEVFEAEQIALRRLVALKFVTGRPEDAWIRFEAEAQALALIDHSNIARLYDARRTPNGVPYLVMEFVRGIPIDEYCDRKEFTVSERIRLFVDVCHALQHCHDKGLVHGDLHPPNILIAEEGDKPLVKVIDFGLVEALGKPLGEGSRLEERPAGAPEYVSPETLRNTFGRDARTDVFSLGGVLYKLLCGLSPRARISDCAEPATAILAPVPTASSRYYAFCKDSEAAARRIAETRKATPSSLHRLLSGDVDTILACSLASDQQARYRDAGELGEDLHALLRGEALRAMRGKEDYEAHVVGKWIGRNRRPVLSAAAVLVGAVLLKYGLGETAWVFLKKILKFVH